MRRIVLASTSKRRKEILSLLHIPFESVAHRYEEDNTLPLSPSELVKKLAFKKADSLVESYPDCIIIGSDTLVEHDGKILPKPKSKEEAVAMLLSLSGSTHAIHTGYSLIDTQSSKIDSGVRTTEVTFRKISKEEATHYVEREDVLGVAGAYDHEHLGGIFVENLNGEFYGSIGLPLFVIANSLKEHFGIDALIV